MITQIAERCGYRQVMDGETSMPSLSKINLNALRMQGMLEISRQGYILVSRTRRLMVLPNTTKTNIENNANWLYVVVGSEDGVDVDFQACDTMEEDTQTRE